MSTAIKAGVITRRQRASGDAGGPGPIDGFLDAVWMERGLSPNTLAAYRADLTALERWLDEREQSLMTAQRGDVLAFMASRVQAGARPRSTARQLSSFRRFYRYQLREGHLREDPTAQIAMPKVGRSLPRSLTEEEVEALLAAPAVSDPLGHRDRTMLEVLYATGLRVSELVNLKLVQVNLNQGVLKIVGKGNRERMIPLGEEAVQWIQQFLQGPRVEILLERQTDFLFPTRRGDRMTRQAFWHIIKRYARKAGCQQGPFAAHAAACLRDSPAEPRCRSARRADAARAQRSVDDPDLHSRGARTAQGRAFPAPPARLSRPGPRACAGPLLDFARRF